MPLTRRQIYRRRRIAVFGGAGVLLAGLLYLPLTLFAPVRDIEPVVTAPAYETAAAVELATPRAVASAMLAEGEGMLLERGSTDPLPIASITKLITALVVLDAHPLGADEAGPGIRMTNADAALYRRYDGLGASVAPVKVGAELTLREMLEVMLIDSAGNYAVSLATWAFGSEEAFLEATRAWLAEKGLSSVVVVEPTGRDPGNVATAADLLRIGQLALADPALPGIVSIVETRVEGAGAVVNSNKLLGYHGIDGLKTGTLNSFGANLLFSGDVEVGAERIPVVGVVLGAVDHGTLNADVRDLYDRVREGFRVVRVATEGDPIGTYETVWGDTAAAVAAETAELVVWSGTPVTATTEVAPVGLSKAGRTVGTLSVTAGSRSATVPIVLAEPIEDPGPGWRLGHPEIVFGIG